MTYKTQHRILKIGQHGPYFKPGMNTEGLAVHAPAPIVVPVVFLLLTTRR